MKIFHQTHHKSKYRSTLGFIVYSFTISITTQQQNLAFRPKKQICCLGNFHCRQSHPALASEAPVLVLELMVPPQLVAAGAFQVVQTAAAAAAAAAGEAATMHRDCSVGAAAGEVGSGRLDLTTPLHWHRRVVQPSFAVGLAGHRLRSWPLA